MHLSEDLPLLKDYRQTLAQTVLLLGCTVGIEPDRLASSVQLYAGAPRARRFFHGDRPALLILHRGQIPTRRPSRRGSKSEHRPRVEERPLHVPSLLEHQGPGLRSAGERQQRLPVRVRGAAAGPQYRLRQGNVCHFRSHIAMKKTFC
jgi:hypothetical protein